MSSNYLKARGYHDVDGFSSYSAAPQSVSNSARQKHSKSLIELLGETPIWAFVLMFFGLVVILFQFLLLPTRNYGGMQPDEFKAPPLFTPHPSFAAQEFTYGNY